MRIEFIERVIEDADEEEIDRLRNLHLPEPKVKAFNRRIYLRLNDIFAPKEIPDKKNRCFLECFDGTILLLAENYDTVCIRLDDAENKDKSRDVLDEVEP